MTVPLARVSTKGRCWQDFCQQISLVVLARSPLKFQLLAPPALAVAECSVSYRWLLGMLYLLVKPRGFTGLSGSPSLSVMIAGVVTSPSSERSFSSKHHAGPGRESNGPDLPQ